MKICFKTGKILNFDEIKKNILDYIEEDES
jgi:hypothetical protein